MNKHTPTPWKLVTKRNKRGFRAHIAIIRDGEHEGLGAPEVAWLKGSGDDGAFLIKACNSHDELTAQRDALQKTLVQYEFLKNCASPGDIANIIMERDNLRVERDRLLIQTTDTLLLASIDTLTAQRDALLSALAACLNAAPSLDNVEAGKRARAAITLCNQTK